MKFEDTMMSDEEIVAVKDCELETIGEKSNYFIKQRAVDRAIAHTQAKITWDIALKAGYKEALEGTVMEGGYESVKKAGIREVMEWIKAFAQTDILFDGNDKPIPYYCFDDIALQAFKKEKGL